MGSSMNLCSRLLLHSIRPEACAGLQFLHGGWHRRPTTPHMLCMLPPCDLQFTKCIPPAHGLFHATGGRRLAGGERTGSLLLARWT